MIHMPHRSVTRFFIPLIDVMLLLFCVFLLMPIANEQDKEVKVRDADKKIQILEREVKTLRDRLREYQEQETEISDIVKLRQELERLRKLEQKPVQEKIALHVVDINPEDGRIYFFDPANADVPKVWMNNDKDAQELIARHRKEAPGKDLYYFFLYPRQESGYPTLAQVRQYRSWFTGVGNSLRGPRP